MLEAAPDIRCLRDPTRGGVATALCEIAVSSNVGIRLEGRWTPTYIKSDPEGYWCDPYWGCYTVAEAEFSNQFELSGGIIIRF